MSYETIRFEVTEGVGHIVLARAKEANTITLKLAQELRNVAEACHEDPSIRAVLISAENGPIFSAGGDLVGFASAGDELPQALENMLGEFHPAVQLLSEMDAPVIVAVNGSAAGAGLSIVLSASFVLATDKARFSVAYTGAGLTPDGSSTYFLPRLVGLRRAEELIVTNRQLNAEEALDWGVINQIVDETELLEKAMKMAKRIAKGPSLAFGNTRRLLLDSFDSNLQSQLDREGESIVAMTKAEDGKEGIQAFLNKRQPSFVGQ